MKRVQFKMQDINTKIRAFVMRFLKNSNISDEDNLFKQGMLNSLFSMQLVVYIEKEFDISVENEDMELSNFNSIGAISRFISKKLQN